MKKLYTLFTAILISLLSYSQAPVLNTVVTVDGNVNGRIDLLLLTFDIPIDQSDLITTITSGSTTQFSVAGYDISSVNTNTGSDSPIIEIGLEEGDLPDTDAIPQIFIFGTAISNLANDAFVGVLSQIAEDGAAPVISEFVYSDVNSDGAVDFMTLIYSEEIDGVSFVAEGNFNFDDRGDFGDFTFPPLGDNLVTGSVTSTQMVMIPSTVQDTHEDSGDIEISTSGEFVLSDGLNTNSVGLQDQAIFVDAAGPILIQAVTLDSDGNGEIDQIELEFSENIDPADLDQIPDGSGNTDQFDVHTPEYSITFVGTDTGSPSQFVIVYLDESDIPDTDATPTVTVLASSFTDTNENLNVSQSPVTTVDGAAPAIHSAAMNPSNAYVEVVFSEPIERTEGGVLTLNDFDITISEDVASLSVLEVITPTGESPGLTENTLLFTLGVSPNSGDYDQMDDYVVITPVNGLALRESASTSANLAANSTDILPLNDLLEDELPHIVSATWNTINNPAFFLGYIELTFNEPLFRDFDSNASPRLANTFDNELNGVMFPGAYVNGSNVHCDAGELCITYSGVAVTIGTGDGTTRLRTSTALQIQENDDYSGDVYRLYFDAISAPFVGIETFEFGPTGAVQIRGRVSGNFMTPDYTYTMEMPDLVPATFNTATFQDEDHNGIADQVVITLDPGENFNDNSVQPSDFNIGGTSLVAFLSDDGPNDGSITLSLAGLGLDGTETLELEYVDSDDGLDLADTDGNELVSTIFPAEDIVDEVPPAILSATTADTDRNGSIDEIQLVFTEPIDDATLSATFDDFVVDGYTIWGYSNPAPADDNLLTLLLDESGMPDTDVQPAIQLLAAEIEDLNNNSLPVVPMVYNQDFNSTVDEAAPVIIAAETDDTDGNGFIDRINVTFSENIAGISADPLDDFFIDDPHAILTSVFNGTNGVQLILTEGTVPNYDTDATPAIRLVANQIVDQAEGASISTPQDFTNTTDGAAPAIVEIEYRDIWPAIPNGRIDHIQLRFSEPLSDESVLSRSNLVITNTSNFGINLRFDEGNTTDLLTTNGATEVGTNGVSLQVGGQYPRTREFVPGTLAISTQGNISLADMATPPNLYTDNEPQSHALIVDGAAPVITDLEYKDTDDDGFINRFYVTFSETVDGENSFISSSNILLDPVGDFVGASFGTPTQNRLSGMTLGTYVFLENQSVTISTGTSGLAATLHNSQPGADFLLRDVDDNQNTIVGVQAHVSFIDDSVPFIVSAVTQDTDYDGMLDRIVLTLSEVMNVNNIDPSPGGSGDTDQFQLADDYSISLVTTPDGGNNSVIYINIDESGVPDTDMTPALTILEATISDLSGNNFLPVTAPPATVDGAGPVIVSATTVDDNSDGHIDAIDVELDGQILDASLDAGPLFNDFSVDGYDIIGYDTDPGAIGGGAVDDEILRILLAPIATFDTDVMPEVTLVAGEIQDAAMNSLVGSQAFTETVDGAAPVILSVTINDGTPDDGTPRTTFENEINASETPTFSLTVSEPVTASINIQTLVAGKNSESMVLPSDNGNGSHTYLYTTGENGALMNNGLDHMVEFTADDEINTTDTDNSMMVDVDNLIPTITITALETVTLNPTIGGIIDANGDGDVDDLIVEISLDDAANWLPALNDGGGSETWSFNSGLGLGIHDIDARVTDLFGNQTLNNADTDDELQIGGVGVTVPELTNICIDGEALELDPIVIQENKNNDFKPGIAGQTFFINLPDGFAFSAELPTTGGMPADHADISSIVYSYQGVQTLRVQVHIDDDINDDEISIVGLHVLATGDPSTMEEVTFASGTASIFGINNGDVMATLTSVDAPSIPNISDQDGGSPITELGVELGNNISLYSENSGNIYNWYDVEALQTTGLPIYSGITATMTDLSVNTLLATGFNIDHAGLYSIYVGEEDPQGCESELRKINIYVYNRQVSPQTFNFIEIDTEGSQITFDKNEGFSGVFFGFGLTNVSEDATHSFAQFIPSFTGAGTFNITYQVENDETGEMYNFVTVYNVIEGGSIFDNFVEEQYCDSENLIVMDVIVDDIPEIPNFFFYGLQLRERGTTTIVSDVLVPPADWSEFTFDSDQPWNGWEIDPQDLDLEVGLYTIDRLIVPEIPGAGLGDIQIYNAFDIAFNATPEAVLSLPNEFVCETDEQLTFTATLNGSLNVIVNEYQITDLTNGNGQSVVASTFFNPSDPMGILEAMGVPMGTYPVGQYSIDYTSNPLDDANGCTDAADQIVITVLPKPEPINLTIGLLREDRGELVSGVYTFEYCEGETIDPFEFSIEGGVDMVTVFANASLTSVLETIDNDDDGTLTVTGIDMFGSSEAVGGTDADFHYVYEVINLDGGCVANSIEVRYVVHEVPDNPIIDLTTSVFGGQVSDDVYEFNYCSSTALTPEDLETIILNPLPADAESYFNIYDEGGFEIMHGLTSSEIILTHPDFNLELTPGDVNEFHIEEVNFDNSFPFVAPQEGIEFTGCISSITRIFVNVHGIPNTPIQQDFSDNPHELDGTIRYYLCQGDQLDFTINPPDGVNDYVYDWFEDELLLNPISVTDNQGDRIVSDDLMDETFGFDPEEPGTYTMYTRIRSNVRTEAFFDGCPSALIRVDVIVFPASIDPLVSAITSTSGELTGGFTKVFDFCVGSDVGLPEDTPFHTEVSFEGVNGNLSEVQWFIANEDGTEITSFSPVAVGTNITAFNLGIQGVRDVSLSYAVVHNTDIVPGYGDFEGCFSNEIEFVQINVTTQPNPNFTYFGIGEGGPTTFNFIDDNLDEISDVTFEVRRVSDNSLEASFNETLNVNSLEADFAPSLSAGTFEGTLVITTSTGCQQSHSRTFRIQELIPVSRLLEEHFDTTSGGWFAEFQHDNGLDGSLSDPLSQRASSWEHGDPDGITINSTWNGQGSAWMTTGNTTISNGSEVTNRYVAGEKSWVISPVYNFIDMKNPAISFLTYHDFELNAGVAFQYSLDRGDSWETLGNYDPSNPQDPSSGFGWYTENGNPGAPGNTGIGTGRTGYNPNRVAWSGKYTSEELLALKETNGWKESIHSAGQLAGMPSVMFRFALSALGADTDELTTNGFGFDELKIFELERNTIVEHFTTSISDDDLLLTTDIYEIIDQTQSIGINYFTDLSNHELSIDLINARNAPDPGARAAYYGIGNSATVLDGEVLGQKLATESSFSLTDLERKRLQSVLFSSPIIENVSTDSGILSLSASFTSRASVENMDLSAIIAIVEREVVVSNLTGPIGLYKNGDVLKNVLRVLLPNSAGHNVVGNVDARETISVEADWAVYNVFDPTKLRVIAFIQDNETKEILQSGYLDVSTTEIIAGIDFLDKFSVSPIPADDRLTIEFKDQVSGINKWSIFDMGGKQVSDGVVAKQDKTFNIDTRNVKSGMYLLYIYSEQEDQGYPIRIIVGH
ncbi:MAG: T9SS type A sorting domain-containing protein [Cyclobacteriaceae bacterium]